MKKLMAVVCGLSFCFVGGFGMPPNKDVSGGSQVKKVLFTGKGCNSLSSFRKRPFRSNSERKDVIDKLEQDNKALKRYCKGKEEENKAIKEENKVIKEGNRNLVAQNEILSKEKFELIQQNQELFRYCEDISNEKAKVVDFVRSMVMPSVGGNGGAYLKAMSTYCKDQVMGSSSNRMIVQNEECSELFNFRKHDEIINYFSNHHDEDVPMYLFFQFVEFVVNSSRQGFNFLCSELGQFKKESMEKFEELSENNRQLVESNQRLVEQSQIQGEELKQLKEESKRQSENNRQLAESNQQLVEQSQKQGEELKQLKRQYEELCGKIQRLSSENNELRAITNSQGVRDNSAVSTSNPTSIEQSSVFDEVANVPYDVFAGGRLSIQNKKLPLTVEGNFINGNLDFSEEINIIAEGFSFTFRFSGQDDGSLVISADELSNAEWMNRIRMLNSRYFCLKAQTCLDTIGIALGEDFVYKGQVVRSGKPSGMGVMFRSTGEIRKGSYAPSDWLK